MIMDELDKILYGSEIEYIKSMLDETVILNEQDDEETYKKLRLAYSAVARLIIGYKQKTGRQNI